MQVSQTHFVSEPMLSEAFVPVQHRKCCLQISWALYILGCICLIIGGLLLHQASHMEDRLQQAGAGGVAGCFILLAAGVWATSSCTYFCIPAVLRARSPARLAAASSAVIVLFVVVRLIWLAYTAHSYDDENDALVRKKYV
mmetsp:Transcript_87936/g.138815  ORF Transcript_87936/g.138815 Transcript_87936/m.138815 type:complete len:141 (-) Transcript_87936:196-618(-)